MLLELLELLELLGVGFAAGYWIAACDRTKLLGRQ
jgi:hypothetical protein